MVNILVTGGSGFIGSNFIFYVRSHKSAGIINLDKLTYASNSKSLEPLQNDDGYIFQQGDIGDRDLVLSLLKKYQPQFVVNFAAESHVDRSILSPATFIQTNVVGTFYLLESVRAYYQELETNKQSQFRFLHISTDEVYGSLRASDPPFTETTPYSPNSPYAASKASSDHLVRAYHHTYNLPTLTINCSNNYGPRQFPEKLIPLMILSAISHKPLPIYGNGQNIRDWLYVEDHCRAIYLVLTKGKIGETYNIGGGNQPTNLEVVKKICAILDEIIPRPNFRYESLITFVKDRPGHDYRYCIDFSKIKRELGWQPIETLDSGLRKTIVWYIKNPEWLRNCQSQAYNEWLAQNYGGKL
ncbi:MAG: dTDP-glucose 4,6-dehydratase [Pseudanabaenaceae cyanobacterium]